MSGVVNARVHLDWQARYWDVIPDRCPAISTKDAEGNEKPQHGEKPICYRLITAGERRACPYWVATVAASNSTDRVDPGSLLKKHGAGEYHRTSAPCGVLCQQQRRNRPPGAGPV